MAEFRVCEVAGNIILGAHHASGFGLESVILRRENWGNLPSGHDADQGVEEFFLGILAEIQ